jgi:enterochelin esterase-like enzyme/sugar lactone lactonase YvrE
MTLLCCALTASCQDYSLGPDSQPQPNTPKGTVTRFVLPPGRFYPGTPHNCQLYVPAQYNAAKPAPFMIFLDGGGAAGNSQRVPVVLDNLIAKGDVPPMIAIFIDPGVQPALSDSFQGRRERIFEYDNVSPRFAQFLEEELIAEVAKKYNLSKDPNDHAIEGVSTGAVGAFVAAWERPDLFHRVLSFIGTYVDMKGADQFPALIRRTEPKPIRIFLQDGKNDHLVPGQPFGTFYGGSWPINNELMFEAFQFAGYDVKLTIGEGGHDMRQGAAIMPDALRWLWRDYPKPIVAGVPSAMTEKGWDPRGQVYGVLVPGKGWEQVGGIYKSVAGPTADKDGNVYFIGGGAVYKSDADGKVAPFRQTGATAIRVGPDGRVYAATDRGIVSWGPGGDEKIVAKQVHATALALNAKGDVYFIEGNKVGAIGADGKQRVALDAGDQKKPSVLTFSPDQALMDVGDADSRFSWSYQVAADGKLINGEPFFKVDTPELEPMHGPTGAAVDTIGQVYWATGLGIQFCEQNGRCAAILSKPERGTINGIAFGGPKMNWLYVAEGDKLFRRETKSTGVTAWSPVKPPNPPL